MQYKVHVFIYIFVINKNIHNNIVVKLIENLIRIAFYYLI